MNRDSAQTPFSTYRRILRESLIKLDALVQDHKRFGLDGPETRLSARELLDLSRNTENHLEVVQAHLRRISQASWQ